MQSVKMTEKYMDFTKWNHFEVYEFSPTLLVLRDRAASHQIHNFSQFKCGIKMLLQGSIQIIEPFGQNSSQIHFYGTVERKGRVVSCQQLGEIGIAQHEAHCALISVSRKRILVFDIHFRYKSLYLRVLTHSFKQSIDQNVASTLWLNGQAYTQIYGDCPRACEV